MTGRGQLRHSSDVHPVGPLDPQHSPPKLTWETFSLVPRHKSCRTASFTDVALGSAIVAERPPSDGLIAYETTEAHRRALPEEDHVVNFRSAALHARRADRHARHRKTEGIGLLGKQAGMSFCSHCLVGDALTGINARSG